MLRCLFYVVNQRRFLPGTVPRLLLPRVNMLISSKICNNITAASIGTMDLKITFCSKSIFFFLFFVQFKRITSHKFRHLIFFCRAQWSQHCSIIVQHCIGNFWLNDELKRTCPRNRSRSPPSNLPGNHPEKLWGLQVLHAIIWTIGDRKVITNSRIFFI